MIRPIPMQISLIYWKAPADFTPKQTIVQPYIARQLTWTFPSIFEESVKICDSMPFGEADKN